MTDSARILTHDLLEACVRKHRPDLMGPMRLTPIRTGKFNDSYYVDVAGESLVLRVAPPDDTVFVFYERAMMRQEPAIHRLLIERTDVPVARIDGFDDTRETIDRDFLVMERLAGTPLSEASGPVNTEKILYDVGRCLRQVHAITADAGYGYLGEHKPMEPQPTWLDAFRVMWGKMIDDVAAVGYYDSAEQTTMRDLLERHAALFDRDVPSSLLHMDVWGQNILVDEDGRLSGLLDWDRALWGDPEIEFAVLDYCGISHPAFWRGYGEERDLSSKAQVRNIFYLLYEIQKYIVIRHGRGYNPSSARSYKDQVMQMIRRCFG
ncbi:aminoglycoside phosphotransferase family protein [Candidatus Sumerlaeota bacterium]|nr:aminoglycoside phosphotransferase family protein [Candidatus Sumerlaeota bacterium]